MERRVEERIQNVSGSEKSRDVRGKGKYPGSLLARLRHDDTERLALSLILSERRQSRRIIETMPDEEKTRDSRLRSLRLSVTKSQTNRGKGRIIMSSFHDRTHLAIRLRLAFAVSIATIVFCAIQPVTATADDLHLHCTPRAQAEAMYTNMRNGQDPRTLYANYEAADEIWTAYNQEQTTGASRHDAVDALTSVIEGQMSRGVLISRHLQARAVDVRNRTMTSEQRQTFERLATDAGGSVLSESEHGEGPHFHVQF